MYPGLLAIIIIWIIVLIAIGVTYYYQYKNKKAGEEKKAQEKQKRRDAERGKNLQTEFRLELNYLFYTNQLRSKPSGLLIEQMLLKFYGDYSELENNKTYMQWLFPTTDSMPGLITKPLQEHEIGNIKANPLAMERLLRAYRMMLDYFGLEMINKKTGRVVKSDNWRERYTTIEENPENIRRITRIIKSLGELGYQDFQEPFVRFLAHEVYVSKHLPHVEETLNSEWIPAVTDETIRKELEHLVEEMTKDDGAETSNTEPTTVKEGDISDEDLQTVEEEIIAPAVQQPLLGENN